MISNKEKKKYLNYIGWYGVVAILLAYALLNFGVFTSNNLAYQLMNLTGAVSITIEAFSKKDKQPAALNIVWATIALIAIINIILKP